MPLPPEEIPELEEEPGRETDRRRVATFYLALLALVVIGLTTSFAIGSGREAERDYSGRYSLDPASSCLGTTVDVRQSGQFASLSSPDGEVEGALRVDGTAISGDITCADGGTKTVDLEASATSLSGRVGSQDVEATRTAEAPPPESQQSLHPSGVEGEYELAPLSLCLGGRFELNGESGSLTLDGAGKVEGSGAYESGVVEGTLTCADGTRASFQGEATGRKITIEVNSAKAADERLVATKTRELSEMVAAFLVALFVIVVIARVFGAVAVLLRQPRVMGEVIAGLVLGPTVLGALAPEVSAAIFPTDLIVTLGVFANLGVLLYMFIIGVRVDVSRMWSRFGSAVAISNGSLAIPLVLGTLVAIPTYELVAPDVGFTEFALFMGVAMSITAFPVLARILAERGLLQRSIGATALAAAAIDDVCAWFLIALATAFATSGTAGEVARTIVLAIVFCVVMLAVVRPLLARAFGRLKGSPLPANWLAAILAGVLLVAFVSETIGIAVIFGSFLMGLAMPRTSHSEDAVRRIEDFVVLILLPLFFAYTGLRTNVGLLNDPALWVLAGGLLAVAIVGKFAGAIIGARVTGVDMRRSAMLGVMMNTRGLTELIALNLALDLGVISEALFTALVLMALITTFMAGPLLNMLDRRDRRSEEATDGPVPEAARA